MVKANITGQMVTITREISATAFAMARDTLERGRPISNTGVSITMTKNVVSDRLTMEMDSSMEEISRTIFAMDTGSW